MRNSTKTSRRAAPAAAAIAIAASLLLAACSSSGGATPSADSTPVVGGTLTYASGDAEPTCLDPHVGGNYPQALIGGQYIESLVSRDTDGKIIPWLATDWTEGDDSLSWTFTLRDDVEFTDGTAFDAEAVKTNIEHVQNPDTGSSTGYLALAKISSIDVVDATTVTLNLSAPDSSLLESLSQPWVGIESPAALERGDDVNCESPVGTGPFIITKWVKQDSITLERNDDYNSPPADASHEGPAYLETIVWKYIPDSASRYAALQSGEVDVIDNAQPDTIVAASKQDQLSELNAPRPGSSNRIELNSGKAPFNDVDVREAFIRSAQVDAGIKSLFFETAERSYSPLSSIESAAYSDPDLFDYDLDAANELLDGAGWTERDSEGYRTKDGVRLTVVFPVSTNQSIPAEVSLFEQIQATTKEAGFAVELQPLDLASWYGVLGKNAYDAVSAPYTKVGPDVLRILYDTAGIKPAPSGYFANHSQVSLPEIDEALTEASATSDEAERNALYEEAQKAVLEGYYILPLYDQQNHYLLSKTVKGLRAIPTVSTPTFYDVWLSE